MISLKTTFAILSLIAFSLPGIAHAKVTCESYKTIIESDTDEKCEAIERGARRCFTALNRELARIEVMSAKNKKRPQAIIDLAKDYETEIQNWKYNFGQMTQIGEGRGCINEAGGVEQWIIEMEADAADLVKPDFGLKKK